MLLSSKVMYRDSNVNNYNQPNMLLLGRYCHFRRIRNAFVSITALFIGYLMGVNTAANNCFRVPSHRASCKECHKPRNEMEKTDSTQECARKLSVVIASFGVNQTSKSSLSDMLSEEEKQMQKMIETIVNQYQADNSAMNAVRVHSKEFFNTFDYGYPTDNIAHTKEMLMFYKSKDLVPSGNKADGASKNRELIPFIGNLSAVTDKCQEMNVVMSQAPCLAISMTTGSGSFHVQRWSRHRLGNAGGDSTNELIPVSRGLDKTYDEGDPPKRHHTEQHWSRLRTYFNRYEQSMKELKAITERIKVNNAIIVMVSNFGHSELLMNFICSAKSRKLDVSSILVFATDEEAFEMTESLGVTAYMGNKIFDSLPSNAAESYADRTFASMMHAKVVAAQLINFMGYDCLFQDLDVHWYRNPLQSLHQSSSKLNDFDILIQDDGQRSLRYAPYYANSGFYYVRYNDRTRFLFTSLLMQGDVILKTGSHQQLLASLLADHASWTGLKVKVLGFEGYPGGFSYHNRPGHIKKIISGEDARAEIFHMSWTENKADKLRFMKQMGMWHLKEECVAKKLEEIKKSSNRSTTLQSVNDEKVFNLCCSVEPLISCHYRDTPSVIDCSLSPPINGENSASFWKES